MQASAAAGLGVVARRGERLPWTAPPADLFPEPDETGLRELALTAIDAARAAGATFADIRIGVGQAISFTCSVDYRQGGAPQMDWPRVQVPGAYGIRAIVDGAWGFAAGLTLTPDAVRRVAQLAVGRARGNRPRRPRTLELAPIPRAEQGRWSTPIEQDPFRVPVGQQADLVFAALAEAGRVTGVHRALAAIRWNRHVRVFASSEDAFLVQRLALFVPTAFAAVDRTQESPGGSAEMSALHSGPYGYEAVTRIDLKEEFRKTAERAVSDSRCPPPRPIEVGRYDLVFAAPAVAGLLAGTLADALNLERALGYHANWEGTSFAAPPADILGQYRTGSPLLTLRADRTSPHGAATVGWDDEGVPAGEHAIVRDGVIVDYLTNRQTAMELAGYYRAQGAPVQSRGCASGVGPYAPTVRLPNLTMQPGREDLSVEDLVADTKKGYYIDMNVLASDQQQLNTQGWTSDRWVREIRNGKLGARVSDLAFQFITPDFWRRMDAIGGAGSAAEKVQATGYVSEEPLQVPFATVRAVPARVRDVNVQNYGRKA